MGLVSRLFGRTTAPPLPSVAGPCPHLALGPRWNNWAHIGVEEKIIGYSCRRCQAPFTVPEGRDLLRADDAQLAGENAV